MRDKSRNKIKYMEVSSVLSVFNLLRSESCFYLHWHRIRPKEDWSGKDLF